MLKKEKFPKAINENPDIHMHPFNVYQIDWSEDLRRCQNKTL